MSGTAAPNTNTPVTSTTTSTDGKVNIDAGGGPLTFDELDQLTSKGKKEAKTESKEERKPESKEKKSNEKSQDLTSDTDKGKKPEPKKAESKESKDSEDGKKAETEEKPARKTVKAKYEDSELDIDEDATVPVKINGKEEMVAVKDLLSNYSGKTAWDKQFTELHKMRKTLGTREAKLGEASSTLKSIFEEQDPDIKMFRMAQFAGVDPIQYRSKFLNDNISLLEKWSAMTEDERKADALAYEAKIHKLRADTLEKTSQQEQAHRELTDKIGKLRASHQVSEDEFANRYDQLKQYAKSGQIKAEEITPEFIIQTIEKDRIWDAAAEKLDSLDLGINEEERAKRLNKLVETAYSIGLKPKDMPEMVDELWGAINAQKKVEDKKKKNDEFMHGKKPVSQQKSQSSEPLLFEDL